MSNTSNIDDILATAHLPPESRNVPQSPEEKGVALEPVETVNPNEKEEILSNKPVEKPAKAEVADKKPVNEPKQEIENDAFDEYGNEKPAKSNKTYTEDEVNARINEAVRERLARLERNNPQQQPNKQQQQQAADAGFNYDPNSQQDWQAQLKDFIKQTNAEVQREQIMQQQRAQEERVVQEFEAKFHQGMSKFQDFRDVVGTQPITDAMTMATRAMKDPAAFLYAAAKNHAPELGRIAQIPDPYTQMVEIGRLEERMKKVHAGTKAPRPITPTREDSTIAEPEAREMSFDELLARNDSSRMARMRGGRRR